MISKTKIDLILKVVLVFVLFAVPISLAMTIWCTPALETNSFLVGLSAINIPLSIAEVMFLVRAVIFPRDGRKWWKEIY